MRQILILFFLLVYVAASAQLKTTYKQYKLGYDTSKRLTYVKDTITDTTAYINCPYTRSFGSYFKDGFLYLKTGDMRALANHKGELIIGPSHFIHMYKSLNRIGAYICSDGAWMYMNYKGDTLSYGKAIKNNYIPKLDDSLNVAIIYGDTSLKVGYLSKDGRWAIPPKFQYGHPFEEGEAKVKFNNLWGIINTKGDFIIEPQYETEDF